MAKIADWPTLYPDEYPDYYAVFTDYSNDENARYGYNKNGAMTGDPYKGSTYSYNALGMPKQVSVPAILGTIDYKYSATGQKLEANYKWHTGLSLDPVENTNRPQYAQPNSTLKRNYIGNIVYENNYVKRILFDNGYFENGNYYFYLRDHLGNNSVVVDANGVVRQRLYYYPYGKVIGNQESYAEGFQPYKFGGKEAEPMFGLGLYDFEARQLDKVVPRFTTMDPLAEKYYNISPYAYAMNNPIKFVDPDGRNPVVVYAALEAMAWLGGAALTTYVLREFIKETTFTISKPGHSYYNPSKSDATPATSDARAATPEGLAEQKKREERSRQEDVATQESHDKMVKDNVPDGSGDPKGGKPNGGKVGATAIGVAVATRVAMELTNPNPSKDANDAHTEATQQSPQQKQQDTFEDTDKQKSLIK